jgi:hypothetical protein
MRLKSSVVICVLAAGLAVSAQAKKLTDCTMRYDLKGWSVFYKTAGGTGTIRCDNGQHATVRISAKGGGLTAGKTEIHNGLGHFSKVSNIKELFGSYNAASAGAAAGKAVSVSTLRKGPVRLEMSGKGKGFELGAALGRLSITKK